LEGEGVGRGGLFGGKRGKVILKAVLPSHIGHQYFDRPVTFVTLPCVIDRWGVSLGCPMCGFMIPYMTRECYHPEYQAADWWAS